MYWLANSTLIGDTKGRGRVNAVGDRCRPKYCRDRQLINAQDLPPLHMSGPSHVLLQVGPHYEDINGEYRGGGVEDENEGGGMSIE